MMNLYIFNANGIDYVRTLEIYNNFSSNKNLNIKNVKSKNMMKLHILGRYILLYGLIYDFGLAYSEISINKNKLGKPYITNHDIYFNISYSYDWVICCISDSPVGVDIEKICDIDKNIIEYISHKNNSWRKIRTSSQLNNYFFTDWCLKESFVKYLGLGLSYDVRKLNFVNNKQIKLYINNKQINDFFFKTLDIIDGYKIAITTQRKKSIKTIFLEEEFLT